MKQVFAFVIFLAVSAWSSVNLIWTEFQFEKGYLEVDTAKIAMWIRPISTARRTEVLRTILRWILLSLFFSIR